MYYKQLGILPILSKLIGSVLVIFSSVAVVRLVISALQDILPLEFPKLIGMILIAVGVAIFLLFPFILLGLILASIFPSLKVESQGIKCKFLIFTELLKWDELTKVKSVWGHNQAIVITRHGFFLFNGLYFHFLHGLLFGINETVLIVSPGTENVDKIFSSLVTNCKS